MCWQTSLTGCPMLNHSHDWKHYIMESRFLTILFISQAYLSEKDAEAKNVRSTEPKKFGVPSSCIFFTLPQCTCLRLAFCYQVVISHIILSDLVMVFHTAFLERFLWMRCVLKTYCLWVQGDLLWNRQKSKLFVLLCFARFCVRLKPTSLISPITWASRRNAGTLKCSPYCRGQPRSSFFFILFTHLFLLLFFSKTIFIAF